MGFHFIIALTFSLSSILFTWPYHTNRWDLFLHVITQNHTLTLGRTSLDEWSARHWGLCLQLHTTATRDNFTLQAGFKPAIPAKKRSHSCAWGLRPRGHWGDLYVWRRDSDYIFTRHSHYCSISQSLILTTFLQDTPTTAVFHKA